MSLQELLLDLEECEEAYLKPSNGLHAFMRDAQEFSPLLTIEGQNRCFQAYIENCKKVLQDGIFSSNDRYLPPLTHKVWLTSETDPKLPLDRVLVSARDFYASFPKNYEHKIWVNNDWVATKLSEYFSEFNIAFIDINKASYTFSLGKIISSLITDKKFAFACDLLRIELLALEGGIYSDWGIKFLVSVPELINKFRFTFILGDGGFFQNSLMASSVGCPFFKKLVNLLSDPDNLASNTLKDINSTTEGWLGAGPLITAVFLLTVSPKSKILLLRGNGKCLKWAAQKSWYTTQGSELIGARVVEGSQLSILTSSKFCEENKKGIIF